ncbi:MAG: hypothetical protein ACXW2L_19770, partial [Burkholderiales bacterium]
ERVLADKRVVESKPTAEQLAMAERVRKVLSGKGRTAEAKEGQLGVKVQSLEGARHEPQT